MGTMSTTVKSPPVDEIWPACEALSGLALKLTRNHTAAEELMSDTAMRALERIDTFRGDSSLKGWVRKIMVSQFNDACRRRKRDLDRRDCFTDVDTIASESSFDDYLVEAEARTENVEALVDALDEISPQYAAALRVRFGLVGDEEVLKVQETAERLACKPGTIMSRCFRGTREIRIIMGRDPDTGLPARAGARKQAKQLSLSGGGEW